MKSRMTSLASLWRGMMTGVRRSQHPLKCEAKLSCGPLSWACSPALPHTQSCHECVDIMELLSLKHLEPRFLNTSTACVKLLGNHSGYQLSQTRSCCRSSPQPCSASSQSGDNRHGHDDHRVAEVLINRLMTDQENLRSQILQVELSLINYRNVC